MRVIEVDGIAFEEVRDVAAAPAQSRRAPQVAGQQEAMFAARMANWRKVVMGRTGDGGTSEYCAGWAKLYVQLGDAVTIRSTTCLPGCPVPSAEPASP